MKLINLSKKSMNILKKYRNAQNNLFLRYYNFDDYKDFDLNIDVDGIVFTLMFDLAAQQGTAFVLVTHDQQLAARCSRRLTLTHGHGRLLRLHQPPHTNRDVFIANRRQVRQVQHLGDSAFDLEKAMEKKTAFQRG